MNKTTLFSFFLLISFSLTGFTQGHKAFGNVEGIIGGIGKLYKHNDVKQFASNIDANEVTSINFSANMGLGSISSFIAFPTAYKSQDILLEDIHFTAADGTNLLANVHSYGIIDGNDLSIVPTNFYDVDYIEEVLPEEIISNTSRIVANINEDGQNIPRDKKSIDKTTLSVEGNDITNSIDIFPNPATDRFYVNVNSSSQIEVFSIIGEKVINTQVANQNTPVSIQSLKSGVYIIKITQDGTSTTKKLVIK